MPSRSSLPIPLDTPPLPVTARALSPPSQFRPLPFMLTRHPLRTGSPGLAQTSLNRHYNWPRIPQNLQRRELFPLFLSQLTWTPNVSYRARLRSTSTSPLSIPLVLGPSLTDSRGVQLRFINYICRVIRTSDRQRGITLTLF